MIEIIAYVLFCHLIPIIMELAILIIYPFAWFLEFLDRHLTLKKIMTTLFLMLIFILWWDNCGREFFN